MVGMEQGGTEATQSRATQSRGLSGPAPSSLASSLPPPVTAAAPSLGVQEQPLLPPVEAKPPAPMVSHRSVAGSAAASTWYRTDQQRQRSVYRRANPWYRRLARGLIGLALLTAGALGLYAGAGALQDYIDRDRLPSPGAEVPEFLSTSFLITSSAPAPELDGTLTIDVSTRAFEFVGGVAGPQSGVQVVSPDGTRVYVREGSGGWHVAGDGDAVYPSLMRAIPYLLAVDGADDVLVNRLRKGYVELVDKTVEGVDDDSRARYEMTLDTRSFSADYPLQWQSFRDDVVPAIGEGPAVPVTMWVDEQHVVVRLRSADSSWAWERLTYADTRFAPFDPSSAVAPTAFETTPTTQPPPG